MPGIQEWIHKFEVAEGTRYVKLAAIILGAIALTVTYDMREFRNFSTVTAMDAAQVARNLSEGKGFTTDFIRPLSIYLLEKKRQDPANPVLRELHPDLVNPPVYPVLLAGLMQVLPFKFDIPIDLYFQKHQPEVLIALFNQILFITAIFMVFRIARRLFDSSVAWLSALLMAGTEVLWRFSVSGLSTMLLLVILLGIVWLLLVLENAQRDGKGTHVWFLLMATGVGALTGLGALTRYSFGWLIIPVLAFLAFYFASRRLALCLAALGAFFVILSPWLARNHALSGHLFGIAGYAVYQETPFFQGNKLERFMSQDFENEMGKVAFDQFVRKLVVNTNEIIRDDLVQLGGNWVTAFFLAGLLIPFRSQALSRMRVFVLICLSLLVVVQALGTTHLSAEFPEINSENLLILMAPLVFIYGAGMFFILLDQVDFPIPPLRTAATGLFAIIISSPLLLTFLPPRSHPLAYPPYWPPGIHDLAQWIKEDELMMSDMPWAVAWYGNRQCVWVTLDAPYDPKRIAKSDFYTIYDYQKTIQALYLTRITTDARFYSQMLMDKDHEWGRFMVECLLRTNVPPGFPMRHAPSGYLRSGQLYLSDYPRWKHSEL